MDANTEDWKDALEIVVAHDGHDHYRPLCEEANPRHEEWRRRVCQKAQRILHPEEAMEPAEPPQEAPPGVLTRLANFAKAIAQHAMDGARTVPDSIKQERLAICRSCTEYYDADKIQCNHPKCGCHLEIKTQWADQSCPIHRWEAVPADGQSPQPVAPCGSCGGTL